MEGVEEECDTRDIPSSVVRVWTWRDRLICVQTCAACSEIQSRINSSSCFSRSSMWAETSSRVGFGQFGDHLKEALTAILSDERFAAKGIH